MTPAAPTAQLSVGQLAERIARATDGQLVARIAGESDTPIRAVAPLDRADEGELAFLANVRYRNQALASRASALVLGDKDAAALFPGGRAGGVLIACANPYAWFTLAAQELNPPPPHRPGCDPRAAIAADAVVATDARIDAHAVIDERARVEAGAWIGAGSYVGPDAVIGAGTRLYPGVRVMAGCSLGARGIVHSGAVIGSDGFGFAPFGGRYIKIPQTGRVVIGDDVEIGANTTIDRGTMGDTVIADGVKLDNQVQVAHNVRIGAHTVVAGCVGIAGSAIIGAHCQLGGAAMIHGHISICDGVIVSGGTLISRSISQPGFYSGVFPFMPNRDWERNAAVVRHLDDLRTRLRRIEAGLRLSSGLPEGDPQS
jgi:UDP-3-O-[3-hydroxymyristoyl] glucosamine N-acyltransferase